MGLAGLPKLNMKAQSTSTTRTTSAKSTATNALTNGGTTGAKSFGITAQRTTTSLGLQYNRKLFTSSSTEILRENLNARIVNNVFSRPAQQVNNNSMSTLEKIAMYNMIGQSALGLTGSIVNAFSSKSSTNTGKDITNSDISSTPSNVSFEALDAMKNAKNPTDLISSINDAKTYKQQMEYDLNNTLSESSLEEKRKAAAKATENLKAIDNNIKKQEKAIDTQKNKISRKRQEVKAKEGAKDRAKAGLEKATDSKNTAQNNYSTAVQNLANAKSELASIPKTITKTNPDGTVVEEQNPKYTEAEQAVKNAETKKAEAEKALNEATDVEENAKTSLKKAAEAFEEAQKEYDKAKAELEELNSKLDEENKKLDELRKNKEDAEATVKKYNDAVVKQKEYQEAVKDYGKEIEKEEKRLEKMEDEATKDMFKHANDGTGTSASKTPDENMIALKGKIYKDPTGPVWERGLCNTSGTRDEFIKKGYIENSDGSFTDPRTGTTMINTTGNQWVPTCSSGINYSTGDLGLFDSRGLIATKYPGALAANDRYNNFQKRLELYAKADGQLAYRRRKTTY